MLNPNWPMIIAGLLILLKQAFKLHLQNKPNSVDYLKTIASIPVDVSFLVVSFFIKAATVPNHDQNMLIAGIVLYLIVSVFTTVLWRISDSAVSASLGKNFLWAFPLNAALSIVTFYIAFTVIG
ncbi:MULTISPECIES: hypothetical protein [unclassified Janthinobacterium]|uniref:hypothetical protein n=1 Tax=unclassified Janthinobacterium TaxID=2610881 RepID=UPI001612B1E3|nr:MULTISPECIES: hypothetical protein [unclassified Janthinobacterium]MBB5606069.1 hypothetical protein [Janthinobacterium sp. S3T4]MBB5616028.1 hypothetical protein [Janthinobacterium sp. S3M3]